MAEEDPGEKTEPSEEKSKKVVHTSLHKVDISVRVEPATPQSVSVVPSAAAKPTLTDCEPSTSKADDGNSEKKLGNRRSKKRTKGAKDLVDGPTQRKRLRRTLLRQKSNNSSRAKFLRKRPMSNVFKRRIIVTPTKFLLGGNINDPLNLNSLQVS